MAGSNERKPKGAPPRGASGVSRLLKFLGGGGARKAGEGIEKRKKKRKKILEELRKTGD